MLAASFRQLITVTTNVVVSNINELTSEVHYIGKFEMKYVKRADSRENTIYLPT